MVGKNKANRQFSVKDLAYIAMFSCILFVQEEALIAIPNVSLTVFLIAFFAKKMGLIRTSIIVLIYVLLDAFFLGSISIIYTPFTYVGWMFIPIIISLFFKRIENPFLLAIPAFIGAFLYCWTYLIPNCLIYSIDPWIYLASDVLFEAILAVTGAISIIFLYKPLSRLFDRFNVSVYQSVEKNPTKLDQDNTGQ